MLRSNPASLHKKDVIRFFIFFIELGPFWPWSFIAEPVGALGRLGDETPRPEGDRLKRKFSEEKHSGENLKKCLAAGFTYDKQPRLIKTQSKKGHSNKTGSKPLQHKKPKLKNKGPRRKTGRTRKR